MGAESQASASPHATFVMAASEPSIKLNQGCLVPNQSSCAHRSVYRPTSQPGLHEGLRGDCAKTHRESWATDIIRCHCQQANEWAKTLCNATHHKVLPMLLGFGIADVHGMGETYSKSLANNMSALPTSIFARTSTGSSPRNCSMRLLPTRGTAQLPTITACRSCSVPGVTAARETSHLSSSPPPLVALQHLTQRSTKDPYMTQLLQRL